MARPRRDPLAINLADKGVQSIALTATNTTTDLGNGNSISGKATVVRTDGSTTDINAVSVNTDAANLNLASNPFYRQFTDAVPLTAAALALPDMQGSGAVRDLTLINSMNIGSWLYDAFNVDPLTNTKFQDSINWRPRRDPLAIDLDANDIQTLALGANPVLFDANGDGIKTGTGWLAPNDAWLVLDRNGNGTIDSGRELFGVDTLVTNADGSTRFAASGFDALRSLDGNADGVFNASDAAFTQVRLWQDLNSDGVSQSNELFTLADKGVQSIALTATNTTTDLGNGNSISGKATVVRTDGSTTDINAVSVNTDAANLNLASNPFYRQFTDAVPLTAAAMALPDMQGSGAVRDLREAMSLGTAAALRLTTAVQAFANTTTYDGQKALLDDVILAWASTGPDLDPNLRGLASSWVDIGTVGMEPTAERNALAGLFGAQLDAQGVDWRSLPPNDPDALLSVAQQAGLATGLQTAHFGNTGLSHIYVGISLYSQMTPLGALGEFNAVEFLSRLVNVGGGTNSQLLTYAFAPLAAPAAALMDQAYNALRDSVYGALVTQTRLRPYIDSIALSVDDSGVHVDFAPVVALLQSKAGSDAYNSVADLVDLQKYDGQRLVSMGWQPFQTLGDLLQTVNVTPAIQTLLSSQHIVALGAAGTNFQVTDAAGSTVIGNNGGNALSGISTAADHLFGLAGNDTLTAVGAGDTLDGGDGDDVLNVSSNFSGAGNTYIGGHGNDTLTGTYASDTYVFNSGDGQDTINEYSGGYGNTDVLKLVGVAASAVTPLRSGVDLVFKFSNGTDQITVKNWFVDGSGLYQIEQVKFDDGTTWTNAQVNSRALEVFGTAGNDALSGVSAFSDTLHGGAGNDTLTAVGAGDALDGGDGDDVLNVSSNFSGTGNTYIGGHGNDTLTGTYASDTYVFNAGDGQDTINDYSGGYGNTDVLKLVGVPVSAVTPVRSGVDLLFKFNNSTDQITVKNWFVDGSGLYQIEQVKFDDGTTWTNAQINPRALEVFGTANNDALSGVSAFYDTLHGGAGNDTLTAVGAGDTLDGGDGDDVLNVSSNFSGAGNTYIGGRGNDILTGTYATDTYVFNAGDGQDTINDYSGGYGNTDLLKLVGVAASDVTPLRSGVDLVFKFANGTDQITVKNWFVDGAGLYQIEQVKFDDGTTWTNAQVNTRALEVFGTPGNDALSGVSAFSDTLHGGAGNDTLTAVGSGDLLDGGDGDDVLNVSSNFSGAGNTYIGGRGNDTLSGTYANDTYVFNSGDGQDTINDYSGGYGNTDVLKLVGVTASAVTPLRSGVDMIFKLSNGTDQITVKNWFVDGSGLYQIEQVKFDDGTTWTNAQINTRALEVFGTANNDALSGVSAFYDTLHGGAGNDTLTAVGAGDTLDGGDGDDVLNVSSNFSGAGNTYIGGRGTDTLTGTYANDTYVFNSGDGQDTINDYSAGYGNTDLLKLVGVAVSAVTPLRSGLDMVFKFVNGTDQITVKNWFNDSYGYAQIEQVKFDDGTTWTNAQLNSSFNMLTGSAGADTLTGVAGKSNIISGLDGADSLLGNSGADRLDGGLGADTLTGGNGNDVYIVDNLGDVVVENANEGIDFVESSVTYSLPSNVERLTLTGTGSINGTGNALDNALIGNSAGNVLTGGAGNDTLMGGAGNDSYAWGRGDGADTVYDYDTTAGNTDSLKVGSGVATDQLWFRHLGNDLEVSIIGTADKVMITDWYSSGAYHLEQFQTSDGQALLDSQVANLVNAMAGFAPPAFGQTTLPSDYQNTLNPVIAANWHP